MGEHAERGGRGRTRPPHSWRMTVPPGSHHTLSAP
jgi:hypothetical protein